MFKQLRVFFCIYVQILISFCIFSGTLECETGPSCIIYPEGCDDIYDKVCCTRSFKVECCCKVPSAKETVEPIPITNFFSFTTNNDNTESTVNVEFIQRGTSTTTYRPVIRIGSGKNVLLDYSKGNVVINLAAHDNSTSLYVHMRAQDFVITVVSVTAVMLVLLGIAICVACKSGTIRSAMLRHMRLLLNRRSPPPSIIEF